ncbi:hypothetical protein LJC71_04770 [Desulfosarcina sp. OttesenSCG-928-A07]|nr:hypothetical protein [Desulfosarcina sp. OttesenSCG-928-G17]MDL2329050.1 hypothetical protein [Desulfosarcina sp. OttesenSCG-928-A07]
MWYECEESNTILVNEQQLIKLTEICKARAERAEKAYKRGEREFNSFWFSEYKKPDFFRTVLNEYWDGKYRKTMYVLAPEPSHHLVARLDDALERREYEAQALQKRKKSGKTPAVAKIYIAIDRGTIPGAVDPDYGYGLILKKAGIDPAQFKTFEKYRWNSQHPRHCFTY